MSLDDWLRLASYSLSTLNSHYWGTVTLTTTSDVTNVAFTVSASMTVADGTNIGETDMLTAATSLTFNASTQTPTPDFDGDGTVGFADFLAFAGQFGAQRGDGRYQAKYDLNSDGKIDFADFLLFASSYGQSVPTPPQPQPPTPPPGGGVSKMYWTNGSKIQRANLDGSQFEDLITTGLRLGGIALDVGRGKMYWTEEIRGKIRRANLDGSQVEDLITTGLEFPYGIALDVGSGKMYWTEWIVGKIRRANLDGSNVEELGTVGEWIRGIALDVGRGKMYWTDQFLDKIQRANLDGSNVEDLITTGLSYPYDIALDVGRGKMYWPDQGTRKIQRANLDGSNVENLITGLRTPGGISLDVGRGKMYWTDQFLDKIQRANLDGSNVEDLITTGLTTPGFIALDTSGPVGSGSRPDLIVESPSVSEDTLTPGQSFTLQATVRNRGTWRSSSTILHYFLSSNATISTSDTRVGAVSVSGLSASGMSAKTGRLKAPWSTGTYYYGACVASVTSERTTDNNCSDAVRVTVRSGGGGGGGSDSPDLIVEPPWVSDDTLDPDQSFTLRVTVRNQGRGPSESTNVYFYLSSDATISTSDTSVDYDSVPALSASGSSSFSVNLEAPTTPGTYYYIACVDVVPGETDTRNNCSRGVRVTVEAPDLVVESVSVSDNTVNVGQEFTLYATVRNQGRGPSESTDVDFYRSSDATISSYDRRVDYDSVPALSASGSSSFSVNLEAPTTPGTYYYGACVDAVRGESDTDNNCSNAVRVTVLGFPDLIVESFSVSDRTVVVGEGITARATVRNRGNGASESTRVVFYEGDDSYTNPPRVRGLSASETYEVSSRLRVPSRAGTYYYHACVEDVRDETDTDNNCSRSVSVTVRSE